MRSIYRATIEEATGEHDPERLAEIEECMRQDIFHSTLDWQTRGQLMAAAREAVAMLKELDSYLPTRTPSVYYSHT